MERRRIPTERSNLLQSPRAESGKAPLASEVLVDRLAHLLAEVRTSDIPPLIEALLERRAVTETEMAKPPIADPPLFLLHQWRLLSLGCFNGLCHACSYDPDGDLMDYPRLSHAANRPIETLLAIPNFNRASLMELALVAQDYGHVLRQRSGMFLPPTKDMEVARTARSARLAKEQKRWHELSLMLHERNGERLSWKALARRHGRSVDPLRVALQVHEKLMLFQAKNELPQGKSPGLKHLPTRLPQLGSSGSLFDRVSRVVR
ncbi:hypothetical protein JQK15_25795 [Sphingobium sp. BHU LFT2]|uniref:hypothetical protein n=1 Tax=Sphingobium sp. BHU LFT2 TaxID=2807634 RepID=UPI001BE6942F|nr:hypothetical protein [Sphingobium sp. BHU LFT2]MBT2246911.1 hypothetical protein [Sphingobium sp. BHU LFT2]